MSLDCTTVLGTRIDALTWDEALSCIVFWAKSGVSRMVCLCNVHVVVTARSDPALHAALAQCELATPDGAPLAWLLRQRRWPRQPRINGPDLMWRLLAEAEREQLGVFFYGSTTATLARLVQVLQNAFPTLRIAGYLSPPFRALSAEEASDIRHAIHHSGAQLVMVGLGCPKQEKWMAAEHGRIHAVMLGVGAAFDYHAGTIRRAPAAWQRAGFEWLYRLAMEPSRLLRRYLVTNTLFLLALPGELWRQRSAEKHR